MYEAVEAGEGVGPQRGRAVLFGAICVVELVAEVGQVGEGKLAGVGAVAYAEEAQLAGDEVAGVTLAARGIEWGAGERYWYV